MVKLSKTNAACEGFFGRLKVEFFYGRDWSGWTAERFIEELSAYIRWYREERLKAFDEGGRAVCFQGNCRMGFADSAPRPLNYRTVKPSLPAPP